MFECHWGVRLVGNARYEVGSVSGWQNTLDYCTGNRWKKFLIKNLDREILSANYANFLKVIEYIIPMRM